MSEQAASGIFLWGDLCDAELLIDLLGFLHQSRRTAVLTAVGESTRKSVYFRDGSIIAASSDQPEDRFGDIMFRRGMISREQLDLALRRVGPGRKIGNVLLDAGLIEASDLWKVIRVQIEEIVYSLLLMEIGQFTVARYDKGQVPNRTPLDTQHILLEGLRRKDEMLHLRDQMPADTAVLARTGWTTTIPLSGPAAAFYGLVDGQRTVRDLYRSSGLGAFGATRALHHLLQAKLVCETPADGAVPQTGSSAESIIDRFNEAFSRVHASLAGAEEGLRFRTGVQTFFRDALPEVAALFVGVEAEEDGRLPAPPIFGNLHASSHEDKLQTLRQGLNEYLRFLLFVAREALPYTEVERLAADVRSLVRSVGPQARGEGGS